MDVRCSTSTPADHFTRILQRIRRSARLIERYPKTWRKTDENTLRDIVITAIGPEYPVVNGEANSGDGRSDILVQDCEGRTLFIGECKRWKGRDNLARGLEQLLGYANWRDNHLGLIIFVTGSIAYTPRTIAEVFAEHPCYKRPLTDPQEDGIYRHLFCLPKDPCCKVEVAVVLLHVPRAPETGRVRPRSIQQSLPLCECGRQARRRCCPDCAVAQC